MISETWLMSVRWSGWKWVSGGAWVCLVENRIWVKSLCGGERPAISKWDPSESGAFLIARLVKNPPEMQETLVWFLSQEDPPVFWPGEFYGLYSPWGHSQTRLSEFHFYFFHWKWGVETDLCFQELVSYVCLFLAALDLRCYTRESSSCGEYSLVAGCRLLIAEEHGL